MRPAARFLAPALGALALLAALGVAGCDAPDVSPALIPSILAWRDGLERAVTRYRDETRASEARLSQDQRTLRRKGDAEGARRNYLGYCRSRQRLAMVTIRAIDALGEPPRDGRRLVDLLRRFLKHRLNSSRKGAEAVMAFDFDRADRLVENAARDEAPLGRAILDEIERIAPGTAQKRKARNARATNATGQEDARW